MTEGTPTVPAGWFVDPQGSNQLRWWDGSAWTHHVTPNVAVDAPVQQAATVPAIERPVEQAQSAYGQSAYGQSTFGQSSFGQSSYGQSSYGQSNYGYARRPITAAPPLTFGESIATVFRKYADFSGVASRSEYWWWYLFSTVITLLLYVPIYSNDSPVALLASLVMLVWTLGTVVPYLAVTVRRLRDAGHSWLYLLWGFVPFGSIVLIVVLCQASKGYAGEPARQVAQYRDVRWPQQ